MRYGISCVAALALLASAEDTTSPLTFTYQTFTDHTVETATTTYGLNSSATSTTTLTPSSDYFPSGYSWSGHGPWSASSHGPWQESAWSHHGWGPEHTSSAPKYPSSGSGSTNPAAAPTSYVVNPADNAYPDFSNITGALANSAPAPGLANSTVLVEEALLLISQLKVANSSNCQTCKNVMTTVADRMKVQQETLSDIAIPFCTPLNAFLPFPICVGLLKVASNDIGGIFPAMDMQGEDGQTLCAFMFGSCDLPAPPQLDLEAMFNGTTKPAPREISPSTKEPLKVLHISDYHLDMRYVVGSEANCRYT